MGSYKEGSKSPYDGLSNLLAANSTVQLLGLLQDSRF